MARRMGLEDIIRDAINNIGTGGTGRQKKLLKRMQPAPAVRRKTKGSYRDQLSDAIRFGGKRPERKVVKTLMSSPPIKVYNDGSRERVKPKPNRGRGRKPATMPRRPMSDATKYRQPKPTRKKDK